MTLERFSIMDSRGQQHWSYMDALEQAKEQARLTPGVEFYLVEIRMIVKLDPGQEAVTALEP
jgi:hypothetical protein